MCRRKERRIMVRVSISQIRREESGDVPELLAEFIVGDDGIHAVAGDRVEQVATISVIDPDNGDRVLSAEEPVRWARLLPLAFRSGDLAVRVNEVAAEAGEANEEPDPMTALAEQVGDEALAETEYA
jgi:hypothetical protein